MRRKVIQDFANVFCQRIAQLPDGYDLASFAHHGSGTYELDIVTGNCKLDGKAIPRLRTCDVFKEWLFNQLDKHHILRGDIKLATIAISVNISEVEVKVSFGHEFASAYFKFGCRSEIRTDEKTYTAQLNHEQTWGFDWFYQQLYGSVLPLSGRKSHPVP